MGEHAILLLIALVLDWVVGDPDWLWKRISHPVAGFGKAVSLLDGWLNKESETPATLMKRGAVVIALLILFALLIARGFDWMVSLQPIWGQVIEVVIIWMFIAQKSLGDHVGAVAIALREGSITKAREVVSKIVGRDPKQLDESGVSRAAIESLAENFGDGVVAPAFWYLVFGLPGLLVYKMINTADSMIAHRNEKYLHFGRAAAKVDDLANWLPARLSALLIIVGGTLIYGLNVGIFAFKTVLRDAGLHRSPNAGWPEAGMAGVCNIALGGPRKYQGKIVSQAFINATGKRDLSAVDIDSAMKVFSLACFTMWAIVGLWALLF